jgi:hypothetical protein
MTVQPSCDATWLKGTHQYIYVLGNAVLFHATGLFVSLWKIGRFNGI